MSNSLVEMIKSTVPFFIIFCFLISNSSWGAKVNIETVQAEPVKSEPVESEVLEADAAEQDSDTAEGITDDAEI